jgi:hypothetical protein
MKKVLFSIYKQIFLFLKKIFSFVKEKFDIFNKTHPYTSIQVQLAFIYFFALIDLFYATLSNIFALHFLPVALQPFGPFLVKILDLSFFQIWGSPEKIFLMSYVVIEFIIIRSTLKLSKFVKYNVLVIFSLLMVQSLLLSFWEFMFHREISDLINFWSYDEGMIFSSNPQLAIIFFLVTFLIFLGIYLFFYKNALKGRISTLPGLTWLTDSVAFWLHIKTPTMKFKGRKKKDDPE